MPKYRKRMTGNYAEKIPMENVDEGNRLKNIAFVRVLKKWRSSNFFGI
jgi:hypothetical protein